MTFRSVKAIGRRLPGVEEGTAYGAPALKYRGQLLACVATNKAAEPNTLVVRIEPADCDALLEEAPDLYYLKDHYVGYGCVLVRMARVNPDAVRDLLIGGMKYLDRKAATKRAKKR